MRVINLIFLFLTFCGLAFSQEDFDGDSKNAAFLLNKTSPEQAIKILGNPKSDKAGRINALIINKWVAGEIKKEDCRILSYSSLENFSSVKLTFLNNLLIVINFTVKNDLKASSLSDLYKIPLIPIVNRLGVKDSIDEFEKTTGDVLVAEYPETYYLLGANKSSVLTAKIFDGKNRNDLGLPNRNYEVKIKTKPITGKVAEIQILSRKILK
jgi:hypothetical protein